MSLIENSWYTRNPLSLMLLPLAGVYCLLSIARGLGYRYGLFTELRLDVPVIVVGNITVGGAGKTPFVAWLVTWLQARGLRPGIVARGYRGRATSWPQAVSTDTDPLLVGDEPVMLVRQTGCPVVVGPNRVAAARQLVTAHQCNIIVSDDGLQHYRLARDFEIAVVDGSRREGNGFCLPAGPLREPRSRLQRTDLVLVRGKREPEESGFDVLPVQLVNVLDATITRPLETFSGTAVHAVAGIGYPQRFFDSLCDAGLELIEHPFPDHHDYHATDFPFTNGDPVVMTEKDAVKCHAFARDNWWYLDVAVMPDPDVVTRLEKFLTERNIG
jgi:tetraacyldisaccharide 4'-kinase